MYKNAFEDIRQTASGWVGDTLYDKESTSEDIRVALAYLVSMIETYGQVIRNTMRGDNND